MGLVSVVTSGKGGAGKSTVTAGLGCALAKLGHRVLVVDTDAGLRSLDLMLGVGGSTVYDMADIFAGNCEPIRAIYPSPVCPNVFVVPAPVSFEKLCTPQDMKLSLIHIYGSGGQLRQGPAAGVRLAESLRRAGPLPQALP